MREIIPGTDPRWILPLEESEPGRTELGVGCNGGQPGAGAESKVDGTASKVVSIGIRREVRRGLGRTLDQLLGTRCEGNTKRHDEVKQNDSGGWRKAILCLKHKARIAARLHTRRPPYSSSQDEKKPPPHAIFASLCFSPHQPRYRADNYAKLLVAFCISYSYPLMPNLPVPTASSLGKLGSAV